MSCTRIAPAGVGLGVGLPDGLEDGDVVASGDAPGEGVTADGAGVGVFNPATGPPPASETAGVKY